MKEQKCPTNPMREWRAKRVRQKLCYLCDCKPKKDRRLCAECLIKEAKRVAKYKKVSTI